MPNPPEPLNIWDCFNPRELAPPPYTRVKLFGNRNVGNVFRTNIQIPRQTGSEERFVITNWYARTNILTPPDEFLAFASSAIVTFVVGAMPRCQLPLSELLQRKENGADFKMQTADHADSETLARNMYAEAVVLPGRGLVRNLTGWEGLEDNERTRWRRASRIAHAMVAPPIMAFIPERQNYDVDIVCDRRALGALLEVLPTNVAPESLIWVHLEGVRRHVVHR